jgi:hypothetical protein
MCAGAGAAGFSETILNQLTTGNNQESIISFFDNIDNAIGTLACLR